MTERNAKYLLRFIKSAIDGLVALATNTMCATACWLIFDSTELTDLFHGNNLTWLQWMGLTLICDMLFSKTWITPKVDVSALTQDTQPDDD